MPCWVSYLETKVKARLLITSHVGTVDLESVLSGSEDEAELLALLKEHLEATGSPNAAAKLADWENERSKFVKVIPVEYRHAMAAQKKEE